MNEELPYIEEIVTDVIKKYNPRYGDDRICICGHPYHRHFDTYNHMFPVGCKYCGCIDFVESNVMHDGKHRCMCCGKEIENQYLKVCNKCASEFEF